MVLPIRNSESRAKNVGMSLCIALFASVYVQEHGEDPKSIRCVD